MRYIFLITIIFYSLGSYSQGFRKFKPEWEVGGMFGTANYLGDLGGGKTPAKPWLLDLQLKRTKLSFGAFGRYADNPLYAFRANLAYGRISGDDRITEYGNRRFRNLHFRSDIIELSVVTELSLSWLFQKYVLDGIFNKGIASWGFRKGGWGRKSKVRIFYNVYGFLGFGVFYHNPKAEYQGEWHALQPLGTEGQGIIPGKDKYKKIQPAIPYGLGFSMLFNERYRVGLEIGWRKTFTDYLDDVSGDYADVDLIRAAYGDVAAALSNRKAEYTNDRRELNTSIRGDPTHKDWYFFTHLVFSYKFRKKIFYPKYRPKF